MARLKENPDIEYVDGEYQEALESLVGTPDNGYNHEALLALNRAAIALGVCKKLLAAKDARILKLTTIVINTRKEKNKHENCTPEGHARLAFI